MAILSGTIEKLKGAFKVLTGSAVAVGLANVLRDIVKEKGVEAGAKFIKALATGKGLENEAVYGQILDRCNLKTHQRNLLIRAIKEMRNSTEEEKTAANNFVILVAIGEPEKGGGLPGERIINGFIHRVDEYVNEDEKVQMIKDNIIHIGTDVETKKKIAVVQKWAMGAYDQLKDFVNKTNIFSDQLLQKSEKRLADFEKRPLWKKLFLN